MEGRRRPCYRPAGARARKSHAAHSSGGLAAAPARPAKGVAGAAGRGIQYAQRHTTPPSLLDQLRRPDDQRAWRRFVDLYTPLLFYWARRIGLQEPDAADLVQEVFALLVRRLPEFIYDKERQGFRAWLRTVLMNKWREIQRRPGLPTTDGAMPEAEAADAVAELAEVEFQRRLAVRALRLMQAEFQPTTWTACWQHAAVGRPAAEVAAELGISVNAVYLATSRVLRRLRQELAGLWP